MQEYRPTLDFGSSPTIVEFLHDVDTFMRFLVGPVGSGKSLGCCAEIGRIAAQQKCYPGDTYRRSRFAIVRNTSPELKTTTIKTWLDLYPENACGPIRYGAPITHHIKIKPKGFVGSADFVPGIDMEVLFIPLDKPQDVKKLRSLELTAAWVNEASEVPKSIVDMLRKRVGRFPARKGDYEAVRPCVFGDLNAPDEDHWIPSLEELQPEGWRFHHQPPAVFELEQHEDYFTVKEPEAFGMRVEPEHVIEWLGRYWSVNPNAENLPNLRTGYYADAITGSNLDQIKRDLQARYHYVQDGKPVIPDFLREIYVVDEMPVLKGYDLQAGLDIGGGTLNPAAVIGQRHPRGPWLIHDEMDCQDLGLDKFSNEFKQMLARPHFAGHTLTVGWGDPAGNKSDEIFETIIFDHLKARGIPAREAPTNRIGPRIEAVKAPMGRMYEGRPGILIHKRCRRLIKALAGAWHFRRVQVSGEDRYHDEPNKNHPWSDLGDALGYLLLGGGEYKSMTRGKHADDSNVVDFQQPAQMNTEFDVFGYQEAA